MQIVLASHNKKKLKELKEILDQFCGEQYQLCLPQDLGITEEPEENGKTFLDNALIKARAISERGYIAIADDSGLCVDALDGAPGVYSARYSGNGDEDNIDLLLRNLQGKENDERAAHFTCCMVCTLPGSDAYLAVERTCPGHILHERDGEGGFGYDPIFFSDDLQKSFGSASAEEKNEVSHRGKACRAFAEQLSDFIGSHADTLSEQK